MAARKKIQFGPGAGAVEKDESEVRWLISYSDFMMQLVCLFILLYSVSATDKDKASAVVSYYLARIGLGKPPATPDPDTTGNQAALDEVSLIGGKFGQSDIPIGVRYRVKELPEGRLIEFNEPIFEIGSAVLSPSSMTSLDEIAGILRSYTGQIFITGTTAPDPADSIDGDAMKLAQARAESAIAHLTRPGWAKAIDPRWIIAEGRGAPEDPQARRVSLLLRAR